MPVRYSYLAARFLDGLILADLPDLQIKSAARTLGRYESTTATLPIATAPGDWEFFTEPGIGAIIVVSQRVDDSNYPIDDPVPIFGGLIVRHSRSVDSVELSLATPEAYFDRRYTGDKNYVATGQNLIIKDLLDDFVLADGPDFRIELLDVSASSRDREYKDQDDKTVYSVMTDLMSVAGGPEWTVGWEFQHNPERVTPVVYVGSTIGTQVADGLSPLATFEMPGCVTDFEFIHDYSSDAGANYITATSSGQGDSRPQVSVSNLSDTHRPKYEYRYSPSTSIKDIGTLAGHATSALGRMRPGAKSLSLTALSDLAPQLGVEWDIGDEVGYSIGTHEGGVLQDSDYSITLPGLVDAEGSYDPVGMVIDEEGSLYYSEFPLTGLESNVPAFPKGFSGIARVIGWEIDFGSPDTIKPILEIVE